MLALVRLALRLTLLAAVTALPVHAAERQTRPVSGFNGIALSAPLKLELTQDDQPVWRPDNESSSLSFSSLDLGLRWTV